MRSMSEPLLEQALRESKPRARATSSLARKETKIQLRQGYRLRPIRGPGETMAHDRSQPRQRLRRPSASRAQEKSLLPRGRAQPKPLSNAAPRHPTRFSPPQPWLRARSRQVRRDCVRRFPSLELRAATQRHPDSNRQEQRSHRKGWEQPRCWLRWTSPRAHRSCLRSFRQTSLRTSARLLGLPAGSPICARSDPFFHFWLRRSCPSPGQRQPPTRQSPLELHLWVSLPAPELQDRPERPPLSRGAASPLTYAHSRAGCKPRRCRRSPGRTFLSSSTGTKSDPSNPHLLRWRRSCRIALPRGLRLEQSGPASRIRNGAQSCLLVC